MAVELSQPKWKIKQRLEKEGRWAVADEFRLEVLKELRSSKCYGTQECRDMAWAEMERCFPPVGEGGGDGGVVAELEAAAADGEDVGALGEAAVGAVSVSTDTNFGLLPKDWPPLPETASWIDELEWAYQNGFFVLCEGLGGSVTYRWERARTPPPSQGALVLMRLLAESRQKFMDLLGKAKTSTDAGDSEVVKRERKRIDQLEAILQSLTDSIAAQNAAGK